MDKLQEKVVVYRDLVKSAQDKYGFIESDRCDSLLFTCLLGCVPDIKPSIYRARAGDRWMRRPISYPSCLHEGWDRTVWERLKECIKAKTLDPKVLGKIFGRGSSTISRDMLLGLAWYAFHKKQLYVSESVIKYALKNKLIMGDGDVSRTFIGPGLLSTFAWISFKLGGPSRWWLRCLPWGMAKNLTGYQAHLQILHGLLRKQVTGKSTSSMNRAFSHYAAKQDQNPLFLIAAKKYDDAWWVMADEKLWPKDRLPTTADRKAEWIPMRDQGDDWKPSEDEEVRAHSGGDLLFLHWLMELERRSS